MGTWTNNDGLNIEFDRTKTESAKGGEAPSFGNRRKLVVDITLADLTDASATVGFVDEYELPEGAIIHSANITVLTAAAGATAVLDLGVIDASANSSGTDDDDGFDAAVATASLTPAGTVITGDGALVGTVLDADYRVAASYDTAAFTAGEVRLEIEYEPTLNRESQ
jgi:hypothetical protein